MLLKRSHVHLLQKKKHDISSCPKIRKLQLKCLELIDVLTKEQIVKVLEMIDEPMKNRSLYDLQALEYFCEILTDVSQDNNLDDNDKEDIIYLFSYIQPATPAEKEDTSLVPPEVPSQKVPLKQSCYQEDPIEEV